MQHIQSNSKPKRRYISNFRISNFRILLYYETSFWQKGTLGPDFEFKPLQTNKKSSAILKYLKVNVIKALFNKINSFLDKQRQQHATRRQSEDLFVAMNDQLYKINLDTNFSIRHPFHSILYYLINFSTSYLEGMDGIAPFFVMHRQAALLPKFNAFPYLYSSFAGSDQSISVCLTANAAVKQSPAPTVSMIFVSQLTFLFLFDATKAFIAILSVIIIEPCEPSLSSTFNLGNLAINLSLISCTGFSTSIPGSILKSSVSLGEIISRLANSSSGISSSRPPQSKIVNFPCCLAQMAAKVFISMGIYFWSSKHSHLSMESLYY